MFTIRHLKLAIVKLLIEQGDIDVNSKNQSENTPLSLAVLYGHEALVEQLLKYSDKSDCCYFLSIAQMLG